MIAARALAPIVVGVACVAGVVALVDGCPDPCTWFGGGCNVNSDCPRGNVCHLARTFESSQCAVVRGTCVALTIDAETGVAPKDAHLCGSVADCNEGECCDPTRNVCVVDTDFDTSSGCDALTCRDCRNTVLGLRCEVANRKSCAPGTVCAGLFTNAKDVDVGVCRQECTTNDDCGNVAVCADEGAGSFCGAAVGTGCLAVDDGSGNNDRVCLSASCVDIDAAGDTVAPYCSIRCSGNACPSGFKCDAQTGDCLRR